MTNNSILPGRLFPSGSSRLCLVLLRSTGDLLASLRRPSGTRWFVSIYSFKAPLTSLRSGVDGWAARRFDQESKFGAWLDVVVDNIGRGLLWTRVSSVGRARLSTSKKINPF